MKARRFPVTRVVALAALMTVLAGCSISWLATAHHSGGDPGGLVLRSLQPATRNLPSGSHVVRTTTLDATWSDACPDNPSGKSGWGPVLSGSFFTTQSSQALLISELDAVLEAHGWRPTKPRDDTAWQFTPVAEWTKRVPGAESAGIGLEFESGVGAPAPWLLMAAAQVPGYALPGC